jgi:hypothetical protein
MGAERGFKPLVLVLGGLRWGSMKLSMWQRSSPCWRELQPFNFSQLAIYWRRSTQTTLRSAKRSIFALYPTRNSIASTSQPEMRVITMRLRRLRRRCYRRPSSVHHPIRSICGRQRAEATCHLTTFVLFSRPTARSARGFLAAASGHLGPRPRDLESIFRLSLRSLRLGDSWRIHLG